MMPRLKTLKIHEYRGHRIFIRHLYGEMFELLIPFRGQLHCHTHEWNKPPGKKYHPYTAEELNKVISAMMELGEVLLDDIIFQWKESEKVGNRIKRLHRKIKQSITNYVKSIKGERPNGQRESSSEVSGKLTGNVEQARRSE